MGVAQNGWAWLSEQLRAPLLSKSHNLSLSSVVHTIQDLLMAYRTAMSSPAYLSAVIALSLLSLGLGAEKSLYDLTAMDATGSTVSLNQYGGKVISLSE